MLKRKIYNYLLNWKKNKNNECLIVKGARQVGKSYIIDYFGKNEYKKYFCVNFYANPDFKKIFDGKLDAIEIIKKMSLYIDGFEIIKNDTLIFLDEIQFCPNARTALKFLAMDKDIDVIASGSLLGLHYNEISSIPVGYERQVNMYSLDFEEFLWAMGVSENAISILKEKFISCEVVDSIINEKYLDYINDYLVVGGMPEVVNEFISNNNYKLVHDCQEKILLSYKDDALKYATTTEKNKIIKCFDSIPMQLAKEYTKFQYKTIEKNGKSSKYEDSIYWLIDAGIVNKCNNVIKPEEPLTAFVEQQNFKLYMLDIGLLTCMYGLDVQLTLKKNGIKNTGKGGIFENLVYDIIIKKNIKVYYYKNKDNTQELEFLYEKDGSVIPIEVKSKNGKTVSLNKFIEKYKPNIAYKIIYGNNGKNGVIRILPYYMLMFLG